MGPEIVFNHSRFQTTAVIVEAGKEKDMPTVIRR